MTDTPEEFATLARNVRRLRLHREWSQQQLADACKLDRTTIVKVEGGDHLPNLVTVSLLAEVFGKPMWVLFFETEGRTNTTQLLFDIFARASAPVRKAILAFAKRVVKTPVSAT